MKKKLLFFLPNLNGGGAERVTVNILRQLDSEKFDITLVLVNKIGIYLDLVPSHVKIIECNSTKVLLSVLNLRRIINSILPDIIYSTLFNTHIAVYLALFKMVNKSKVILRSPNSPKLVLENKQINLISKIFLEKAYKSADKVIAQTPEMKNELIYLHKVSEKKIDVMLNPIDSKLIDENIQNIQNPFEKENINIVAAGRILEQKGFDILIKSFSKIIKKNTLFRLHIIGEDIINQQYKLEELAHKLNVSSYINFLGFQKNPYQFFYFADLYVLSSRWEGLPNTILENLYLEKPIISTRCIPFMDKLLKDGVNSILVDVENVEQLADAIEKYENIKPLKYNNNRFKIEQIFIGV